MKKEELIGYCLSKPSAYIDYPFGSIPICFKVAGKVFAQLYPNSEDYKITLKTNPDQAYLYRESYGDSVVRGYHCPPAQQPYWNTVFIDGFFDDILLDMIDDAYDEVLSKMTKKEKSLLENICSYAFETISFTKQNIQIDAYDKDEELAGTILLTEQDADHMELTKLFVEEIHQCNGLAKELLRRADSLARQQSYRYIIVTLPELAPYLVSLFRKMQYKPTNDPAVFRRKI